MFNRKKRITFSGLFVIVAIMSIAAIVNAGVA
jgi:hypothetical protein